MKIQMKVYTLLCAMFTGFLTASEVVNEICPVSGKPVAADVTSIYSKAVGVASQEALDKLNENLETYLEKIASVPTPAVVNSMCPVSDRRVKAGKVVQFKGLGVGVCCDRCVKRFDAKKHEDDIVKDIAGNEKCIISGEGTIEDLTQTVSLTIGFSNDEAKAAFEKNPDAYIGKLRFTKK